MKRTVYIGGTRLSAGLKEAEGTLVDLEGQRFYRITNVDAMPPFFMTIVSDSDHWMFVSSKGGLTCGRRNPEHALFPYYTDDKIHDASATTGPLTVLLVEREGRLHLWEPFGTGFPDVYEVERNLYKSTAGNKLIFEAVNRSLQMSYRYAWENSDRFGFVKRSVLANTGPDVTRVEWVDGIRNILPYGVNRMLQSNMSTLVDGYKKCEIHEASGLGIFTLSSILTDRAEPSEALRATTVCSAGLEDPVLFLSEEQADAFRRGIVPVQEWVLKGKRGGYFMYDEMELGPGECREWMLVAEVSQGPSDVPALIRRLGDGELAGEVREDVQKGTERLTTLVGLADGLQLTGNELKSARHFSNTLYNIMRGGVFPLAYRVPGRDLESFISHWNREVYERNSAFIATLREDVVTYPECLTSAEHHGDADLLRLIYEYLPLTFSRRHGDPSRPWNLFSIEVKGEDGGQRFDYQGNWRDIFQNWEALALSFPGYIESFITKFVNASTPDGFNPYRITRDGFDWEVLDPGDPWSNIGYWGDHQVIYLVKLIELSEHYHPGKVRELLTRRNFVYANVPYRIKPYASILGNPRDTIEYDGALAETIRQRVAALGTDGKLVHVGNSIYRVTLAEKLLVSVLARLSHFIPEGGIWMNTQRPEWNDANNALVGNGLSMVTLYYLRRYISMMLKLIEPEGSSIHLTKSVEEHFRAVSGILESNRGLLSQSLTDKQRRRVTDALGEAGTEYREKSYRGVSGKQVMLDPGELAPFLRLCLEFIDHSIAANRREDGLFHAYNLVAFGEGTCSVRHLHEMLEGQVAVISSGYLSPEGVLEVLDALRKSKMYRSDQRSYTLYPDRELKPFLEKNLLSRESMKRSSFLEGELETGNRRIIEEDEEGALHFNGRFRNAEELRNALDRVEGIEAAEKDLICEIFIETFNHREFTGRSGTFFKYEGLGSIYWHMVSKLLLAVRETRARAGEEAGEEGAGSQVMDRLQEHIERIDEGIGAMKPPAEYGAFPIDAYSHTPGFAGVQQPGMTGQVKEDIISRMDEMGISVRGGCIHLDPARVPAGEFLQETQQWKLPGQELTLGAGELGFTLCGTPVIYSRKKRAMLTVEFKNGEKKYFPDGVIPADVSAQIFGRTGSVARVNVAAPI